MTVLRPLLAAAALIGLAATLGPAPARAEALLRPSVVVDGDEIHLGDIFENIGDKAGVDVARAPEPGHRALVDADWLHHVAEMNGLDWKSEDPFLELVIARNGQTIPRQRIEHELMAALAAQGMPEGSQIVLSNRDLQVVVPVDASTTIAVRDLFYDQAGKQFSAVIEAGAEDQASVRVPVTGRVVETIEVPTLAHTMNRGETFATRDLAFVRMPVDNLRRGTITDVDQIIGMAAHTALRAGQPVTEADLQKPLAVTRGAMVVMTLRAGGMTLTAQGRAIDSGSVGDIIHVANSRSNMTLTARIDGPNQVTVEEGSMPQPAPGSVAAN